MPCARGVPRPGRRPCRSEGNAVNTLLPEGGLPDEGGRGRASVLVVDDCDATRRSLRALLEGKGYADVRAAASGEEALDLLGREGPPGGPEADVILMDVEMPGPDGI